MKRAPILPGVDLRVYLDALVILVKNPVIIVVPLLAFIVAGLLGYTITPFGGGVSQITASIVAFIARLLEVFALGSACIMADTAWRRGKVSFEDAWVESRRKSSDLFSVGIGVSLLLYVAYLISGFLGPIGILIMALAAYFLIWAIPAAAIGGIPGAAAIQVSIERVRANPLAAGVLTAVSIFVLYYVPFLLSGEIGSLVGPSVTLTLVVYSLIASICAGYVAIVMAKTYADAAFGRRY